MKLGEVKGVSVLKRRQCRLSEEEQQQSSMKKQGDGGFGSRKKSKLTAIGTAIDCNKGMIETEGCTNDGEAMTTLAMREITEVVPPPTTTPTLFLEAAQLAAGDNNVMVEEETTTSENKAAPTPID